MTDVLHMMIPGRPITKKNHGRIVNCGGKPRLLPSPQFRDYQDKAGYFLKGKGRKIEDRVNVRCVYYMPTRGMVDLVGLLQATDDILVHYGVILDDNCRIVAGHDGSRVRYDKNNPRVEITIGAAEDYNFDAAEVVRCKDCRYWHEDILACEYLPRSENGTRPVWYGEDFCSYGERKNDGK